jgi:uncharacterized membrane protein
MALAATPLAAVLLAFSIFFYAVVYTMWLKRSTAQNIVIGGAAGAFPAGDRLGRRDGRHADRRLAYVRPDLPLDAAALLGAVALDVEGIRASGRSHASGHARGR